MQILEQVAGYFGWEMICMFACSLSDWLLIKVQNIETESSSFLTFDYRITQSSSAEEVCPFVI